MTPDKTIQRPLDTGKWKIGYDPGYEVIAVSLVGMRNRPYPLTRITREEFQSRCMKGPGGEFENNVVVRGTPHWYAIEGHCVCLNPSPAHAWTIKIDLAKRNKS